MVILENIDIDIDKAILQNIDIDKISNRFKFGISNRASVKGKQGRTKSSSVKVHYSGWKVLCVVLITQIIAHTTDWR